jgi:hypothetical protein
MIPPCHYVAESVEYDHREFFATGPILTMVALSKIGEGGAGPGECFSSLTVRIC